MEHPGVRRSPSERNTCPISLRSVWRVKCVDMWAPLYISESTSYHPLGHKKYFIAFIKRISVCKREYIAAPWRVMGMNIASLIDVCSGFQSVLSVKEIQRVKRVELFEILIPSEGVYPWGNGLTRHCHVVLSTATRVLFDSEGYKIPIDLTTFS